MRKDPSISIVNKTRGNIPRLPFAAFKTAILGPRYELSVAFVTPKESARLAKTYKKKRYEANVLSFRLSKASGELVIAPAVAKREAKSFGKNYRSMLAFLFIHGAFHLAGHSHGSTMERQERRIMKRFGL